VKVSQCEQMDVISKIIRYRCHAVTITIIRVMRLCVGVASASTVGSIVGIAWLGAVAVTVRVRSVVEAISF
jgi:hypothetical protein